MNDGKKLTSIYDALSALKKNVEPLDDGMELISVHDVRSVLEEDVGHLGFKNFQQICADVAKNLGLEVTEVLEEIVLYKLRRLEFDTKTIETTGQGENRRWKIRFMR